MTTFTGTLHSFRRLGSLFANHRSCFYGLQIRESEPTPTKQPTKKLCVQTAVLHEPDVDTINCETPLNPPSANDSDSSTVSEHSEHSSDTIISELSDPFRDSATSTTSGTQNSVMAQDVYMTSGPENLPLRLPMMEQASPHNPRLLPMLSACIKRAFNDAMAGAESRIARQVDIDELLQKVDVQHRELETRILRRVEGMLLARDTEIGRLRKELDEVRS